jgi:predicted nuclease of restriction endonuclease-like (RecB) superfamily
MRQLYREYHDKPILAPLVREISWAKNLLILGRCKDDLAREFYLRAAAWFGQTNFDQSAPESVKSHAMLAVKDHYTFDFLELAEEHSERDLELALVRNLRQFLTELGGAFTFVGNQYRLEGENPPIGIIICRSKEKTVVEYALRTATRPLGVATYTVVPHLPEDYRADLPSPEQIAERLRAWDMPEGDGE